MPILQTAELPKALASALSGADMYMYLEYCASSVTPTDPSTFLMDPKAYYTGLPSNRNYLRVQAVADPNQVTTTGISPASSTTSVRFFGQSSPSSVKMNSSGQNFATGVKCYGAALVLAVDPQDATKDLVLAQSYFSSSVLTKTSSSELFVTFTFSTTAQDAVIPI